MSKVIIGFVLLLCTTLPVVSSGCNTRCSNYCHERYRRNPVYFEACYQGCVLGCLSSGGRPGHNPVNDMP